LIKREELVGLGSSEWSETELASLIKAVFKNGENEWYDLIDELELS